MGFEFGGLHPVAGAAAAGVLVFGGGSVGAGVLGLGVGGGLGFDICGLQVVC